jgi:DNA repair protein RadB
MRMPTACTPLDAMLDGGLEPDAVTLVFGEGGSGKTNLALQCAREAAVHGLRVAFVDTEGVSADRMNQIFGAAPDEVQERLLFFAPYTIHEQERMVQKCTLVQGLGLVVVDSINMHYRLHIDGDEAEKEAGRSLYKQLHHLTTFARKHRVPVLVTGQVFGTEDTTQPFARRTMEHLVKALIRFEKRPDGTRRATVVKHRSIPDGRSCLFRIGSHGLVPAGPEPDPDAPAASRGRSKAPQRQEPGEKGGEGQDAPGGPEAKAGVATEASEALEAVMADEAPPPSETTEGSPTAAEQAPPARE